jgi:putative RecB family exonuclease
MAPPDLPPSTSASQLTTYAICPRKFAFQYVHALEPEFRSTALVLGSAVHSTIAWWFEEKIAGRTPTQDAAEGILAADMAAGTSDSSIRWKDVTPESLEADGKRYLRTYLVAHGELAVTAVEQPFQVDLVHPETGEFLGRPVKGFFDLTLADRTVVEVKTSARGWNDFDLVRHLQVGAYAFAWNTLHGGPSQVDVHVIVKLKRDPRVETYPVHRGEQGTLWWLTAAAEIEASIAAGHFPPKPSSLCRECEFESTCAGWTGEALQNIATRRLPVVHDERELSLSM